MLSRRSILGWSLAAAVPASALTQETRKQETQATPTPKPAPRPIDAPLDVLVPVPPTAFYADGKTHLVYEMHATNFGRADCILTRVEVVSPDRTVLATYSGEELTRVVIRPGLAPKDPEPLRIGAGLRGVVFAWVTIDAGKEIPSRLEHRLGWKLPDDAADTSLDCATTAIAQQAIVIQPPLRGDAWLAANGPSNLSGHRRSMVPIAGGAHIAQRFAIDWLQLRDDGKTYTGDKLDNKNYRCYGTDALAVADATVVAVKDGIPENVPGSRAVPITLDTVAGNHVILDLGNGRYAFYAHLQPSKIHVKINDRVRQGQVIGLVGNSGNATEPHLHFHVCDRNSPLGSEGLPYHLTSFEVRGKGFEWRPSDPPPAEPRSKEQPLQNVVVRFS